MWGPNEDLLQKSAVRKEGEALSSRQSVMLIYCLLLREVRGKIEICVLHSIILCMPHSLQLSILDIKITFF